MTLNGEWTDLDQLSLADVDATVRAAVEHGGWSLGEVLGAVDELDAQLEFAEARNRELVHVVADWARTGIDVLPEDAAKTLWPSYLPAAERLTFDDAHPDDVQARYEEARGWVCEPIAGTGIALVRRTQRGLAVDDYITSARLGSGSPVPPAVHPQCGRPPSSTRQVTMCCCPELLSSIDV